MHACLFLFFNAMFIMECITCTFFCLLRNNTAALSRAKMNNITSYNVPRLTIFVNCFAALPQERPIITGEEKVYASGDVLALNCTSGKSHPAAKLRWFVNGQQVSSIVSQRLYFQQHRGSCCAKQKRRLRTKCEASIYYVSQRYHR